MRGTEAWEEISVQKMKQRWHDTTSKIDYMRKEEREERAIQKREKKLRNIQRNLEKARAENRRMEVIEDIEEDYTNLKRSHNDNGVLILNEVVVPIQEQTFDPMSQMARTDCNQIVQKAREERNQALKLAQQFRNIAEQSCSEKRCLQYELESKVETVRDFWRNKIVEGGSRSGCILRASLFEEIVIVLIIIIIIKLL